MSQDLSTQLADYFAYVDETQDAVDVLDAIDSVQPIQVSPRAPTSRTPRAGWVLVAAAVVVLALGLPLFLFGGEEAPSATTPSPTTALQDRTMPAEWAEVVGTLEAIPNTITGALNGEFIALQPGFSSVEAYAPDGDPRAWIYRSSDGVAWSRERLPQFDDLALEARVAGEVLFVRPHDGETSQGVWRTVDGVTWEAVVFDGPQPTEADFIAFLGPSWGDTIVTHGEVSDTTCIWTSTDRGRSFSCVEPPTAETASADEAADQTEYPETSLGHVGRISDGFFITVERRVEDDANSDEVFNPVVSEILYSSDGFTWEFFDLGGFEAMVLSVAASNGETFIVSSSQEELIVYAAREGDSSPVVFEPIGTVPSNLRADPWNLHAHDRLILTYSGSPSLGEGWIWTSDDGTAWSTIERPASRGKVFVADATIFVPSPPWETTREFTLWVNSP